MDYISDYKDLSIKNFFLTEEIINKKIQFLLDNEDYSIFKQAKTINNKDIYALKLGNGAAKIFIWAGTHGNEHTGITSLFDFCNYLNKNNIDEFTFVIIFCLNIDGLFKFTRVNQLNLDINRDALNIESSESKFFMSILNEFKPDLCISLHDQRSIFNVKNSKNPSILSFLSPSENKERDITENRAYIMKLISYLNSNLQMYTKGFISRYTDEFYPNAFGDNLMKWGYKNILIESGISYNDYYRENTRKYTFFSLVHILDYLKNENSLSINYLDYLKIPENDNKMLDIVIRNGYLNHLNKQYKIDIGISLDIMPNDRKNDIKKSYKIANIGDLSQYYGHIEIDAKNTEIKNKDDTIITLNSIVNFSINGIEFYNYVN